MPYSNGIMQFSVWNTIQTWAGDIVCSRSGLCVLVLAIILVVYCLFRLLTRTVKILLVRLIGGCIKHATTNREALFTATQSGLHLRHFYTDSSILDFKDGPFRISLLAVSEAQLFWPSWQRQVLELHITGLELELTQRHMPTGPAVLSDSAASGQLKELEHLLWHGTGSRIHSDSSLWRRLHRWLLTAAVARFQLQLHDCSIRYIVPGQLGPCVDDQQDILRDAISVNLRSLSLSPRPAATASDTAGMEPVSQQLPSVGAASSDRPDQQPLTRLLIAGVSVAVTTSQAPANAANDTACKEGFSMQESACCMAASSSQHWEQVHVLLRQWQCGVDVWQVTSSCTQQTSKHQTSAVIVKRMGRMDRSAMFVRFRAPSAAQVTDSACQGAAGGRLQQDSLQASPSQFVIDVDLKSITAVVPPQAAAIGSRMISRYSRYQLLSPFWAARPKQPVSACPAAWWQHACKVVLAEVRRRRPPCSVRLALQRRRNYMALYRSVHGHECTWPGYLRTKCNHKRTDAAAAQKALKDAEALMTAYEVATHRIFVALLHSEYLHKRPTLQQQWMEALDGLGGFVDLVPSNYQGATSQELAVAVFVHCPTISLEFPMGKPPHVAQLLAEVHGLALEVQGVKGVAASVRQLQLLIRSDASKQHAKHSAGTATDRQDLCPVLSLLPVTDKWGSKLSALGSQQQQQQQQEGCCTPLPVSTPQPSQLGRIYPDSAMTAYLGHFDVQFGPVQLQLQPQLAVQLLAYYGAFRVCKAAQKKIVPIKQLVLDSFKMHKVPVSFALSSLLAPMTVSCPQLSVVAPLKHLQGLDGLSSEGQIMTDSAVQLVATLNSLHASVGYNTSCYSSLLQQIDATADVEAFFQNQNVCQVQGDQQLGLLGSLWLHPDDANQLNQTTCAAAAQAATSKRNTGGGAAGKSKADYGVSNQHGSMPASSVLGRSLSGTTPTVPLVRLRRVWTRLSTHIPTEPAIAGGERTAAGITAAGVLAWLSPWQIKLVSSTLEQLTAEGHNLWKQFKDMSHPSGAAVLAAARDAAAASAVHAAIGGASEIGSAAAAASKAATAVVQTAGVVSPESVVYSPEKSAHEQQERQSSLVDQLPALSAKTAGRASAEQASISLLCTLPYCEVLFFVDTLNMRSRSHSTVRHRYTVDVISRPGASGAQGRACQQMQNQKLEQPDQLHQWSSRIVPVASLVMSGLKAGSSTAADGTLTATACLSSLLLVNLQLIDLCRSAVTMPTAAGIYLPSGYSVPAHHMSPAHGESPIWATSTGVRDKAVSPKSLLPTSGRAIAGLSANYNAFVLSTFTTRLTAAYEAAALSRWQVLGLDSSAADLGPISCDSTDGVRLVMRGSLDRRVLLRRRWQQVLAVRAFARTLDYAMFLLFERERTAVSSQPTTGAGVFRNAGMHPFQQYQMLYRHCIAQTNTSAVGTSQSTRPRRSISKGHVSSLGRQPAEVAAVAPPHAPSSGQLVGVCSPQTGMLSDDLKSRQKEAARSSAEGYASWPVVEQQQPLLPAGKLADPDAAPATPGKFTTRQAAASTPVGSDLCCSPVPALPQSSGVGAKSHENAGAAWTARAELFPAAAAASIRFSSTSTPASSQPTRTADVGFGASMLSLLGRLRGGSQGLLQRVKPGKPKQQRQPYTTADHQSSTAGKTSGKHLSGSGRPAHSVGQGPEQYAQQQCGSVDFLSRFSTEYGATAQSQWYTSPSGSGGRYDTAVPSTPSLGGIPTSQPDSRSRSTWLVCPQQAQLTVGYKQQPWQDNLQRPTTSAAAPSGAFAQEDQLEVTLSHLKVTMGPHSVSMLLQLVTSFTTAATAAAGNRRSVALVEQDLATAHQQAAGRHHRDGRPRASFNLVLCHYMLNMERVLLPGQSDSRCLTASELETKALLSLLLLDAEASYTQSSPGSALGSSQSTWADVSCSVAHVGLQDLCACEEHRFVLAGADEASGGTNGAETVRQSGQHSACQLSLHTFVPLHMAPLQPLVLTVSVHNCQLVLLRRFVNDVLFVAALINHEGTAFRSCKGQHQVMSSSAAPQSPPSVMILSLRNVQAILPRSHACKTLADKYAEACQMHQFAQQLHQEQAEAQQQGLTQRGGSSSSTCGGVSTPPDKQSLSVQLTMSRQTSSIAAPLHAHHAEVMLLQVAAVTIATPANFLQGCAEPQHASYQSLTSSSPPWMHDTSIIQQIVANSRAVVDSSSAAGVEEVAQQQQQQQQRQSQPAAASTSAVPSSSCPVAESRPPVIDGSSLTQEQHSASRHVKFVSNARQQPGAPVRHGVLLLSDRDSFLMGADAQFAPVPRLSLSTVAGRVWQQIVRRLKPHRRRLVVAPDASTRHSRPSTMDGVHDGVGCSTAGQHQSMKHSLGEVPASEGSAPVGDDAAHSDAVLLADLHGLEVFAGRIIRAQDMCHLGDTGSDGLHACKGGATHSSRHSRCNLTGLVAMVKRTNVQVVVHGQHVGSDDAQQAAGGVTSDGTTSVVALSIPDGLALQLSGLSYRCLMDMLSGNLMYNHSIFEAGFLHANPAPQYHTTFHQRLKFGPKPGEKPNFVLTICSSVVQGSFWANQRWWTVTEQQSTQQPRQDQHLQSDEDQGVNKASERPGTDISVVPCVSALLQTASLCVQTMQGTSDLHVNLYAAETDWRDVRMANTDNATGSFSQKWCQQAGRRSQYDSYSKDMSGLGSSAMSAMDRQHVAASPLAERTCGVDNHGAADYQPLAQYSVPNKQQDTSPDDFYKPLVAYWRQGLLKEQALGSAQGVGAATTQALHLFSSADKLHAKPAAEIEDDASAVYASSQSEEYMGEQHLDASELYPAMLQPSMEGLEEVPDVSIIRTLDELPANESVHLRDRGADRKGRNGYNLAKDASFKFYMGYLKEGTMTIEVVLADALLQWPYLCDLSLISAIINVFNKEWGAAPCLPPKWLQLQRTPWLYFNLVLTNSQVFIPLLTPHVQVTSSTGEVDQSRLMLGSYELLRQVVLRQASLTGEDVEYGRGQQLQQRGIALTFGALRFGYYYGGDGEAITRFDVRNLAGFLRDPDAVTTNWLLPLSSAKLELRQEYPLVDEHRTLEPLLMISRRMIFNYLVRKREQRKKQLEVNVAGVHSTAPTPGQDRVQQVSAQDKQDATSGSYATSTARAAAAAAATPEQRLLALAREHAEDMFGEQATADWQSTLARQKHAASRVMQASLPMITQSCSHMFGVYKRKARSELSVTLAPMTLRAAFSNINAWKTLQSDVELAGQLMQAGLGMWPPRPDLHSHVLSMRAAGKTWPPPPTGWAAVFRQSSMRCNAQMDSIVCMLCDDKPHAFGAPDVLQALAHDVTLVHAVEYKYPKTAPETADRLHVQGGLGLSILNNSNSKWEVLMEPWPLLVALSNPINPLVKSDRTLYGLAVSSESLRVNFHPSSLLSIGDLLAFTREVSAVPVSDSGGQQLPRGSVSLSAPKERLGGLVSQNVASAVTGSCQQHVPLQAAGTPRYLLQDTLRRSRPSVPVGPMDHTETPPSIEQQMALGEGLTRRIPQRYLFQNLTGSHIYYWSPADEVQAGPQGTKKKILLPAHSMHELKVTPVPCKVQHLAADGSLVSSGHANSICIQLAGSWLPLTSVAVDVVGKYRYEARDPLGGSSLPLLLDVLLVGRTKMLRLHSCIWLENNTALKLEPLLQLGHNCATPVVLGPGDRLDALQRLHLRPLKPKEGRFLPAAAAIGGLLFLAPEGHLPTEHDVIRLDVSLKSLGQQQGYIRCCNKPNGVRHGPLHLAASIHQDMQTDPYFITQNLTEVPRPGTLRKARMPLEAAIHIRPTLQLENGLPYDVLGWAFVPPRRDLLSRSANHSSARGRAAASASSGQGKLPVPVASDGPQQIDPMAVGPDLHQPRMSSSSGPGVAQAAAAAAAAAAATSLRGSLTGVQQVLVQEDPEMALAAVVSTAGAPMQILEQLSTVPQLAPPTPSTPTAQAARLRPQSWLHGGLTGSSSLMTHVTEIPVSPRGRGSVLLSSAANMKPAQPDEMLQLSHACDMLLLQRWCRDLLLEEFLATLHLVLSPDMAAKVDVAALCLMDLASLVALAFGVVAEEFGWIAKSFPQAFSLMLKVEEAMAHTRRAATDSEHVSMRTDPQLPWPADQLPIPELFSLLQWMQQSVVRLQLGPGGTADLYLDPQLELYAALRVPALAMQSRPTLISSGNGSQSLGGSDSLWLSYASQLDLGQTSQPSSSNAEQNTAESYYTMAGQPRLGLAALQAIRDHSSVHKEVTVRMTDAARQLAELASRMKIRPSCVWTASMHGAGTSAQPSAGDSYNARSTPCCHIPASVIAVGSAEDANLSSFQQQYLLHPWSSAPGAVLPVSTSATSGCQQAHMQPPVCSFDDFRVTLVWFAVVIELLGDIARLSAHEADIRQAESSVQACRPGFSRHRFAPEHLLDDLNLADISLVALAEALNQQASRSAEVDIADKAVRKQAARDQPQVNADGSTAAAIHAASYTNCAGDGREAVIMVDVEATVASITHLLLKPPRDVDRIFTQFNLQRDHVLTDDEMQALLKFSCSALVDHVITVLPSRNQGLQPLPPDQTSCTAVSARRATTPGTISYDLAQHQSVPAQSSRCHEVVNMQSRIASNSLSNTMTGTLQVQHLSADELKQSTQLHLSVSSEQGKCVRQQELLTYQEADTVTAETISEPQQCPEQSICRASSQPGIQDGGVSGVAAPLRGLRSLRSLWPLHSSHAPSSSAVRPTSADGSIAGDQQPWLTSGQTTISSGDDSDESAEEEDKIGVTARRSWQGAASFRRRPGSSVKHLTRMMSRATGAPVRLVHGQLSDQLRAALDRKMRSTPHHMLPPGPVGGRYSSPHDSAPSGPGSGSLRHHGQQWWSMTLQALGRGAVAAEVHEGRPGFCAPHNLKLGLVLSGGSLRQGHKHATSHSRKHNSSASATLHVLLTASYWLDNRSGLDLVLSDLDRKLLRGLPGPHLKNTADVYTPGLPRDCAAIDASDSDSPAVTASGGAIGGSEHLLQEVNGENIGAEWRCSLDGTDEEVDAALSRVQEIRPALLNDQYWLRFWVEEHVFLPPGCVVDTKSRRTLSFSKTPPSLATALSSPGAATQNLTSAADSPSDASAARPRSSGRVQAIRSQPSGFIKIGETGHKRDIQVKGKKTIAQVIDIPCSPRPLDGSEQSLAAINSAALGQNQSGQMLLGRAAMAALAAVDETSAGTASSHEVSSVAVWDPPTPMAVSVQRLYEFTAEIWPAAAEGPFKATKIVSIKSKYLLFNDTDLVLEYKQRGTPDHDHPGFSAYGQGRRFAGLLQPQERVAFHWDNIAEPRLLMIRPAAPGWPWSGAFPLAEKEDYIGLRLRHRGAEPPLIIPVNTTVGRSGTVLVTFKSTSSVPPIRIENRTKSVTVLLRQYLEAAKGSGMVGLSPGLPAKKESPRATMEIPEGWRWDSLLPGRSLPFAWDDVTGKETLEIVAALLGPEVLESQQLLAGSRRNAFVLDLNSIQKRPLELELRPLTWKLRAGDSQLAAYAAPQPHSSGHPAALPASGVPSGNSRLHPSAAFAQVHAFERSQQQSQQHQEQQPARRILSVKAGVQVAGSGQTLGMDIRTTEGRLQPSSPAAASSSAASTATEATRALRKVKDALFDKKLYVSVFADGPTRVLCFSDTPMAGTSAADDGGSEQLMGRLHQVTRQLMQIDGQLQLSLGPSCALRTARGSTAVPAALLLQQQQQRAAALSKQDVQVPPQLNAAAGAWHSSSTTAAAVVLLQQLGLHPLAGQVAWPLQATAGASMPAPPCRQLVEAETSQVPEIVASSEPATSQTIRSHITSQTAAAATISAAGFIMSDGVVMVNNPDTGLKLYYDRLTLLLDSGLPLGGNCKVKLLSARGLASTNDQFSGYQAKLAVSGRNPVLTGLAASGDQQEVLWGHEEQFSEVTTMSELIVEIWGIYSSTVFGKKATQHAVAHATGSKDERKGNVRQQSRHLRSLPYGSKFLGAVQIPLMHTLPGTSSGGKAPQWYNILRVTGNQQFSGQVQISISWSFTREALLASELSVLERLLEARQEVLALLHPVSSSRVAQLLSTSPADSSDSSDNSARYGPSLGVKPVQVNDSDVGAGPHGDLGSVVLAEAGDLKFSLPSHSPEAATPCLNERASMSLISQPDVFAGMDLGLGDSSLVTLEVDVVEVANLKPRSGWSQDLTRVLLTSASTSRPTTNDNVMLSEMVKSSELPMPVVYVFCGTGQPTDEGFEVSSGAHTLNPCFAHNRHCFKRVGVRNVVRVLLYDRRSALDSRLLGVAQLPVATIGAAGSGPLYMWLPLGPAPKRTNGKLARFKGYVPGALHGLDAASNISCAGAASDASAAHTLAAGNAALSQQCPHVLMRLRVNRPASHNTSASLQANLAGLLVNAKTASGDELLNLTVDTVQCAMLTTSRERQLSVSVRSVQLDNQLLETRQPVVLSPATTGEELVGYNLPKNKHRVTLLTDKSLDDMEPPAKAMWAAISRLGHDGSKSLLSPLSGRQLRVTGSGSSVSAAGRRLPFIRVSVCQTLTAHLDSSSMYDMAAGQQHHGSARATGSSADQPADNAQIRSSTRSHGGSRGVQPGDIYVSDSMRASDSKSVVSKAAIMSFRKVELLMGALDFKTDQAFLEAVFVFLQNMPLPDLWQDTAWQQHIALLQGGTAAQDVIDNRVTDQQQEQQIQLQALVSRRCTIAAEIQPSSGTAGASRQQLSTAVTGKPHTQQLQQHPVSPHASSPQHSRSKSVGSLPNLELRTRFTEQLADTRSSGSESMAGMQASTVLNAVPEATAAAAARAARRIAAARHAALQRVAVLAWLPGKHDQELNSMKGQSSTWYFIEKLYVSALCMNVTIALTSSIRSAAVGQSVGIGSSQGPAVVKGAGEGLSKALGPGAALSEVQRTVMKGIVNRLSGGSNGLQLINVSDVSLRLSGFKLEHRLLNQVGLNSELYRHYFWAGLAELRKVLGGAGPGLVQLPASIIWAGFSVVDLVLELQQGRRKPLHSAFALMHVAFTLLSQLSGVATRCIVSLYALLPVQRQGTLSDHSALQRYVRMPATAGEAFIQAIAELYLGTAAGVLGLFLDPAAGMRLPGALGLAGLLAGLMKGTGGLMVRPAMGVLDASSKCLKGVGLLFLGKRGIQGKLVRRVMPPGASERPVALAGSALAAAGRHGSVAAASRGVSDATLHEMLIASWQARLAALHSDLEGDMVVDVMATRSCRLLLLTRSHILYLKASVASKEQQTGSYAYSVRWLLPCSRIDHVRGEEDRLKIVLEYHSQLRMPSMEAWKRGSATAAVDKHKDKEAAAAKPAVEAAAGTDRTRQPSGTSTAAVMHSSSRVLLRIPLQRSLRCASPELYQQVIRGISRHLVLMMAGSSSDLSIAGSGVANSSGLGAADSSAVSCQASGVVKEYADLYDVS